MIFVVTDPHAMTTVKTDAEIKSIVTTSEWKKLAKLAVGECISFRRSFGIGEITISRTEHN
jgi:hypothetical protein